MVSHRILTLFRHVLRFKSSSCWVQSTVTSPAGHPATFVTSVISSIIVSCLAQNQQIPSQAAHNVRTPSMLYERSASLPTLSFAAQLINRLFKLETMGQHFDQSPSSPQSSSAPLSWDGKCHSCRKLMSRCICFQETDSDVAMDRVSATYVFFRLVRA